MSVRYDKDATGSAPTLHAHVMYRCLPIIGAGVLLLWLSGGMPPAVWQSFFHTFTRVRSMEAGQDGTLLFPLAILAIQSIISGGALVGYTWLVLRELSILLTWSSRMRGDPVPSSQGVPASVTGSDIRHQSAPVRHEEEFSRVTPVSRLLTGNHQAIKRVQQDGVPAHPIEKRGQPVYSEQARTHKKQTGQIQLKDSSPVASKAAYSEPVVAAPEDPFDVEDEAPDLVRGEGMQEEDQHGEEARLDALSEQQFVYGNPFEGPLPDVFHHDDDLKRAVLEQKAGGQVARSETGSSSDRPATKRTTRSSKTGVRLRDKEEV
jgi:hypothetical protein